MMDADAVVMAQFFKLFAQPVTAFVLGYVLAVIAHV